MQKILFYSRYILYKIHQKRYSVLSQLIHHKIIKMNLKRESLYSDRSYIIRCLENRVIDNDEEYNQQYTNLKISKLNQIKYELIMIEERIKYLQSKYDYYQKRYNHFLYQLSLLTARSY